MSTKSTQAGESGLFQSLRPITRKGILEDAAAGFQLAAMNIPQALSYPKIAGTPIVTGPFSRFNQACEYKVSLLGVVTN